MSQPNAGVYALETPFGVLVAETMNLEARLRQHRREIRVWKVLFGSDAKVEIRVLERVSQATKAKLSDREGFWSEEMLRAGKKVVNHHVMRIDMLRGQLARSTRTLERLRRRVEELGPQAPEVLRARFSDAERDVRMTSEALAAEEAALYKDPPA